ncbi:MAG: CHAT domain-containing protein [Saprospiraceae bacterium]|nr:CHAT domain-containing protein [Saprospiraceae bacterium]
MQSFFLLLFLLLSAFMQAQSVDSFAIRQVDSLILVSREYTAKGDFENALAVNAIAEKIALERTGRESASYGSGCYNHGRVLFFKGDYIEAEKWYLESKLIREKVLGKEHPDYAWSLNNLAILYYRMGQYEKSEILHIQTKAIREKTLGKEHRYYASVLNNLANLYNDLGQYEKAEPLFIEAKAIFGKTMGLEHSDYAISLNNLANLYKYIGQFEKAEPLYMEAKAIWEKTLGKGHPDYAGCLNNLAGLYNEMGQYEKTEPLYLEAKSILEKTLGKEHPDYAHNLANLSLLYQNMGKNEKAEPLAIEAVVIREKGLGKEHPEYALSLINLAFLYENMGKYEKAEPLYIEAKAIRGKALGKEHPNYAQSLNMLASLYYRMGQYEKAEPHFMEAKHIWEKTLGKEHPDYALDLDNMSIMYLRMGQFEKAEPFLIELSAINRNLLKKAMLHLSDRELNDYLDKFLNSQNRTFYATQSTNSPKVINTSFDNCLFYKGFLLQAAGRIKQLALSDSVTTNKFNQLKGYQRRLAVLYAEPLTERESNVIAELESQANLLEKDLTRTVAGFGQAISQVTWQEVQIALKPGEAAMEFVHYQYYNTKTSSKTMYAALILQPGNATPVFVPLFEERSLDSLLATQGGRKSDYVNKLYTIADRGVEPVEKPQKTLYQLLWQPLEKELANVKTIYVSPSGLLHRINLAAIPLSEDETLADRYQLIQLSSTRQLVIPTKVNISSQNAILYGGIQYNMDSTAISLANQSYTNERLASRGEISFSYTDSTNRLAYRNLGEGRGGTWNYLKWTEKEVGNISNTLSAAGIQTDTRKGYLATEESFKSIGHAGPSPRILHLATHGFFFPDPERVRSTESGVRNEEMVTFKMSEHPMIRSGLILAGGNYAWQTGKPLQPGMEDRILTAFEISQMNLSNTELVVLSACETGLGDIKGNEGVYGLQRAFKIAGAKYLIMSLWQVPDQETSVFMTTFYKHWLEEKMPIPEAFQVTQKEMRERFINPYQWAGFVLVE